MVVLAFLLFVAFLAMILEQSSRQDSEGLGIKSCDGLSVVTAAGVSLSPKYVAISSETVVNWDGESRGPEMLYD